MLGYELTLQKKIRFIKKSNNRDKSLPTCELKINFSDFREDFVIGESHREKPCKTPLLICVSAVSEENIEVIIILSGTIYK